MRKLALPGAVDGRRSKSTTFLVTSGMSSLFFFFLENYGEPGKVSYDFFFLFSKHFFFLKTILYDPHAKARIVLG